MKGTCCFSLKNGKAAKVYLSSYATKTNRKKLANAYSGKHELIYICQINEDIDVIAKSSSGKALIFNTSLLNSKSSRDTIGVQVMNLKENEIMENAISIKEDDLKKYKKYISLKIPASGISSKDLMNIDQLKL